MRRLLTVLLAMVAAIGIAGCGDDSAKQRNAYADAVNRAQSDFAQSFKSLSRRITSTTTAGQGRRTLQGFEDAVDDVVADLRAIDAPTDVQPLHRRLITEVADYGREIRRAKRAFATGAPRRILDAQSKLVSATTQISTRINRTIAAINRQLQKQS
jgi:hypothetical protein